MDSYTQQAQGQGPGHFQGPRKIFSLFCQSEGERGYKPA